MLDFMKLPLIIVSLFLFASPVYSQDQVGRNIEDHLLIKAADDNRYNDPEKETVGSPYLRDEFMKGTVDTFNGVYSEMLMRYNIHADYIEFKQKNQTYILDPEPRIKQVRFDDRIFVVVNYEHKGKERYGYLELLDSGKVTLFAKKTILYREWQAPKALESGPTPAKYTRTADIYFFRISDGTVMRVESVKKLIENLPDKHEELTQFAKKEKLGIKEESDLKKLLKQYNSL
jgi:hypothetical protein